MLQQTSLLAYHNDVKPTLGQKQARVLNAVKALGSACNQEIADYLRLPINSVTPRVFELRAMGKVEMDRKDIYPATNRKVIYWRVRDGS